MSEDLVRLPESARAAWVDYDPPEFKHLSSALRHAFMSGWLARDSDATATAADCVDNPVPKDLQARPNGIAHNKSMSHNGNPEP